MEGITFFDGLMEQVEFEHKLFESVLKVNFRKVQILKEDEQVESQDNNTEAQVDNNPAPAQDTDQNNTDDKKLGENIKEKLKQAWEAVINWFIKAAETIANKIKNIVFTDNKIVNKYKEILITKSDALKDFPGIDNFRAANLKFNLPTQEDIDKMCKAVANNENFVNGCKELENKCNGALEDVAEKWNQGGTAWSTDDWKVAFEKLATDRIYEALGASAKHLANTKGPIVQKVTNFYNPMGNWEKMNTDSKSAFQSTLKAFLNTQVAYFKALRRACIACGTHVIKTQNQGQAAEQPEAKQEAATLTFLADLLCEQYLDESFSFT